MENDRTGRAPETDTPARRIDQVGWALFLIMTGGIWLAPSGWLPDGSWLTGAGLIVLLQFGVRHACRIPTGVGGLVLGILVTLLGVGRMVDAEIVSIPIIAVGLGIATLVKVLLRHDRAAHA